MEEIKDINSKAIGKYVERTTKVSLASPTGLSLKDGIYTELKDEFSVGCDINLNRKYRGFLDFDIPVLPGAEEVTDSYIFLQSKIKHSSNFSGNFMVRYLDYSYLNITNNESSWNMLNSGVDLGVTSTFRRGGGTCNGR